VSLVDSISHIYNFVIIKYSPRFISLTEYSSHRHRLPVLDDSRPQIVGSSLDLDALSQLDFGLRQRLDDQVPRKLKVLQVLRVVPLPQE
jgi:hypothetical protein